MKVHKLILSACAAALLLPTVALASATFISDEKDSGTITKEAEGDLFAAGSAMVFNGAIGGELFAAGSVVEVKQQPGRSVFAAGESVTIQDGSGYNVFAAANTVVIDGEVANDAYIAANTVIVKESAVINGTTRIAANFVTLEGAFEGDVHVAAERITSNAAVGGDMHLTAQSVKFTGGTVAGDLRYSAPVEAEGLGSVTVEGAVERTALAAQPVPGLNWAAIFMMLIGGVITSVVVVLLAQRRAERVVMRMHESYLAQLGIGFAFLILAPLVAVLLMVSTLLVTVGLVLLFVWFIFLLTSGIYGALYAARWAFERMKRPMTGPDHWVYAGYAAVGSLVLSLIALLPFIGWTLGFIALVVLAIPALGAQTSLLWSRGRE